MRQLGHITRSRNPNADPEHARIDLSDWLDYVKSAPNLEAVQQMHGRNPFTGQALVVELEHSVTVMKDGAPAGRLIWWDGSILVEVNQDAPTEWIDAAASAVGGTFHKHGSLPPPPLPSRRWHIPLALALIVVVVITLVTWSLLGSAGAAR